MIADNKKANNQLMRYAGLATQFFVGIGLGVFVGIRLDKWLKLVTPVFVWVLPLLIIIGVIIAIVKDTTPRK